MTNLEKFQEQMTLRGYDAYIVPTSDFHNSEYISDYFKIRQFLSGFTGSAGTLLVTQDNAYLWTDGRYFIQAEKELKETNIELMKMGEKNVLTLTQFLQNFLINKKNLAIDGRTLTTSFILKLKSSVDSSVNIITDSTLIDEIWFDRPKLPFSILYELKPYSIGKTYKEKIEAIRNKMIDLDTNFYIISSLEDQAWLYNLRGNDILHTPVFLAFTIITLEEFSKE